MTKETIDKALRNANEFYSQAQLQFQLIYNQDHLVNQLKKEAIGLKEASDQLMEVSLRLQSETKIQHCLIKLKLAQYELAELTLEFNQFLRNEFYTTRLAHYVCFDDLWKLLIDRKHHKNGCDVFDTDREFFRAERGYLQAMQISVICVAMLASVPLSPLMLLNIHDKAIRGVDMSGSDLSGFRVDTTCVKLIKSNSSVAGQKERDTVFHGWCSLAERRSKSMIRGDESLHSSSRKPTPTGYDELFELIKTQAIYLSHNTSPVIIPILVERYIGAYMKKTNQCTDEEYLSLLIHLGQTIELMHAFCDGNTRTVVLMNIKELLKRNLPPTCLYNPNIYDGKSNSEIEEAIIEGQLFVVNELMPRRFNECITQFKRELFKYPGRFFSFSDDTDILAKIRTDMTLDEGKQVLAETVRLFGSKSSQAGIAKELLSIVLCIHEAQDWKQRVVSNGATLSL
jgi:hypothetical protein